MSLDLFKSSNYQRLDEHFLIFQFIMVAQTHELSVSYDLCKAYKQLDLNQRLTIDKTLIFGYNGH